MRNSMDQNKSIIVFSSHASLNYMLIHRLMKEFSVSYVIYENQSFGKKLRLIKNRVKKLGIGKVFGQVLFHIFDAVYIKKISEKGIQELVKGEDCSVPDVPSLDVESINSKEVQDILEREKPAKAKYWKAVWKNLSEILHDAGIDDFPDDDVKSTNSDKGKRKEEEKQNIRKMAKKIWSMSLDDQRIALMVLTQFCDSLVWWTQRYKTKAEED